MHRMFHIYFLTLAMIQCHAIMHKFKKNPLNVLSLWNVSKLLRNSIHILFWIIQLENFTEFFFHFISFFLFFNIYQKQTLNLEVWLEWITVCICNVANILGRVSLKKEHHFALVRNLKFEVVLYSTWFIFGFDKLQKRKIFCAQNPLQKSEDFCPIFQNSSLPL